MYFLQTDTKRVRGCRNAVEILKSSRVRFRRRLQAGQPAQNRRASTERRERVTGPGYDGNWFSMCDLTNAI
jgi:hypothetical protein